MEKPSRCDDAVRVGPLRIGIDGRFLSDRYPGIGRYVFNLVRALETVATEEELVLFTDPGTQNSRFDLAALSGRRLRLVPIAASPRSLAEQLVLPRWARRNSLSVFHTPYWWTARRMPCPTVVTLYDLVPLRKTLSLRASVVRMAYGRGVRRVARSARLILTLSQASRRQLAGFLNLEPGRIVVTPGAADPSLRCAHRVEVKALRARLGLAGPYVLSLGINKPHKNLPRLVEAWKEVQRHDSNGCELVVAGLQDRRYPEARRRAQALGVKRIRFLGPVAEADLPALYGGARLFVLPSLEEGFGLPLLEAMACGVAVACSHLPVFTEVAGDAALLFDPADPRAMAAAMSRVLASDELRSKMELAGLGRAARFSWEETARRTLTAYRQAGPRPANTALGSRAPS